MRNWHGNLSPFGKWHTSSYGALSAYAAYGFEPPLVLDFDESYYRTDGTATDLVSAATHTRASSATYVDANGILQTAAINEPRVGHHIWNGSAWVDAGYLHESEARTNLFLSSDDLSNASYWSPLSGASTPVATSPIMGASAWTLSGAGYLRQSGLSLAASTANTVWFRMRLPSSPAAGKLRIRIYDNNSGTFITLANGSTVSDFVYDTSGAVTRDTSAVDFLTDEGNGVYLVGAAFTTLATVTTHLVFIYPDVSNNTQPVDVATPQLEEGSTPSSYNPTAGATVTRAADVMTIPAANLPWPEPVVTEVTLAEDFSAYADQAAAESVGYVFSSCVFDAANNEVDFSGVTANLTISAVDGLTSGDVYRVTVAVANFVSGSMSFQDNFSTIGAVSSGGTFSFITTNVGSTRFATTNLVASITDIRVEKINPLAVSIQMEGTMTYADTGDLEAIHWRWYSDASNYLQGYVASTSGTGDSRFLSRVNGVSDVVTSSGSYYAPGINVPFNIASRHGSTFINGAVDGTALTANLTPTALPYLENTDMQIGSTFNGTIKLVRVWADDLTDEGISEASA